MNKHVIVLLSAFLLVMPQVFAGDVSACGTITSSSTLITNLTATGTCFTIGAHNIILDCQGFTLTSNGSGRGVTATDKRNVTIKNCAINTFNDGLFFLRVNDSLMMDNTVTASTDDGIDTQTSNYSTIHQNTVTGSFDNNIALFRSVGMNITWNTVTSAGGDAFSNGIALLSDSRQNLVANNTITNNQDDGVQLFTSTKQMSVIDNLITDNGDDGIDLSNSTNNLLSKNTILRNKFGIALTPGNGTMIEQNTIADNGNDGVFIAKGSNHNVVRWNFIANHTASNGEGINVFGNITLQINNTLEYNTIERSGDDGIQVADLSSNVNIIGNTIKTTGLSSSSGDGILVQDASSVTIARNTIEDPGARFIHVIDTAAVLVDNNTLVSNGEIELQLLRASTTTLLNAILKKYNLTDSKLIIRDAGEGEIAYHNSITATGNDFTADLSISLNNAFVNSTASPGLNKSANVTLSNVNISNPQIERDAEDDGSYVACPTSICALMSNDQGAATITFNVTGFTAYRAAAQAAQGPEAVWPLSNSTTPDEINDAFGPRISPGPVYDFHRGLDFLAPLNTPIVAVMDGTIVRMETAAENNGTPRERFGNWMFINHTVWPNTSFTRMTAYLHMSNFSPTAFVGKPVVAGEVIGFVGKTGEGINTVHLHLELHRNVSGNLYSNLKARIPMQILPYTNANLVNVTITENPVGQYRIKVSLPAGANELDFNRIEIVGSTASRTMDYDLREGIDPADNDNPSYNGVTISPDNYSQSHAYWNVTYNTTSGIIGTLASVRVYDVFNTTLANVTYNATSAPVTVFLDNFTSFAQWTESNEFDWNVETPAETQVPGHSAGNTVAHADACTTSTGCILAMTNGVNLTGYANAAVTFWRFVDNDLDGGEFLKVEAYNSTTWNQVFYWTHNSGDDNTWRHITWNATPLYLKAGFKVRFTSKESSTAEEAEIDDVQITAS